MTEEEKAKIGKFSIPKRKGLYKLELPEEIRVYDPRNFLDEPEPEEIHKAVEKAWEDASVS